MQDLWNIIDQIEPRMEKVDVTLNNLKRNALREFDFQVDTEEHKKLKGGKKVEEEDDGPR